MIRAKYKYMIRAAVAGALIMAIPFLGVMGKQRRSSQTLQERLSYYETLQEEYQYLTICVLTQDVVAGEELTETMIQENRVQSTQDLTLAQTVSREELLGKRAKLTMSKGSALTRDMIYEGDAVAQDERRVELSEPVLPKTLKENEFIDIRIVFPNGEDYVVVKHKRVYRIIRDENDSVSAIQLRLLEQELLRYQAACVDVRSYQDTRLYALQYTGEYQPAATEYYPVNAAVFTLMQWDPNIVELFVVDAECERRKLLELNLESYLQGISSEPDAMADQAVQTDETNYGGESLTLYTGLPEE
ncbi:MAG: SAF domain-containing protein [bacterium]|nr:SAF domain-containing protein [bacterium]